MSVTDVQKALKLSQELHPLDLVARLAWVREQRAAAETTEERRVWADVADLLRNGIVR